MIMNLGNSANVPLEWLFKNGSRAGSSDVDPHRASNDLKAGVDSPNATPIDGFTAPQTGSANDTQESFSRPADVQ